MRIAGERVPRRPVASTSPCKVTAPQSEPACYVAMPETEQARWSVENGDQCMALTTDAHCVIIDYYSYELSA